MLDKKNIGQHLNFLIPFEGKKGQPECTIIKLIIKVMYIYLSRIVYVILVFG